MLGLLLRPPFGTRKTPSLALLVAITMMGTVAMHIFVPALPDVARDLGASPFTVQLTITLFLVGLAVGQLLYGPLSDRFGRRPLLIGSLALYLIGLAIAIGAMSIGVLIVARVLQSLGGCGVLVLGRAMVRETGQGGASATRRLAILTMAMTLTPALAPPIGGVINVALGWRASFGVLALGVGILAGLVLLTLPETNKARIALPGAVAVLAGYVRLLRSRTFRGYVVAGACCTTGIYAFLSSSPFLFVNILHRSAGEVGFFCLIAVAGMVLGAFLASRLAGRMTTLTAARWGVLLCCLGPLLLLVVDRADRLSVETILGPMLVFAIGAGLTSPNAVSGVMSADPTALGAASSLYGFIQMSVGALFTFVVALWHDGSALPVASVMLAGGIIAGWSLLRLPRAAA
jgi:DHA1 family bicyclomycin/chloramphenicol resistance-like MFS transporter